MPLKYIDLFAGLGSFHYSFQQLGMECVLASDIYEPARTNYKDNYDMEVLGDIKEIEPSNIENYDILCAGFPCQGFSRIGIHKGFDNQSSNLFWDIMKFVKCNQPKVIVLENVCALLKHNNGESFKQVIDELEENGYDVVYDILKCSDYGIPQMRRRLFIVGFKKSLNANLNEFFNLNEYKSHITLSKFFDKKFEKEFGYTIRCGGRHSRIDDRHNWNKYIVNGNEYTLSFEDCLKLQGFNDFNLIGNMTQKSILLGNTIPTNLTMIIGKQLIKYLIKLN